MNPDAAAVASEYESCGAESGTIRRLLVHVDLVPISAEVDCPELL